MNYLSIFEAADKIRKFDLTLPYAKKFQDMIHSSEEFLSFIKSNINESPDKLRLKYSEKTFETFDVRFAIDQIECRRKCKHKIPGILKHDDFIFPSTLSAEQCTNEVIAEFHGSLIGKGENILDMTCGLGIDSLYLSRNATHLTTCEYMPYTFEAATFNMKRLGCNNIELVNADSIEFLKKTETVWDTIFVDPARRGDFNSRMFAFTQCQPDIIANFNLIRSHCNRLLVKASPMLDIAEVQRQLSNLTQLWIISINNDCKEILCECNFKLSDENPVQISTLNFTKGGCQKFDFAPQNLQARPKLVEDVTILSNGYIYEPNASVMKSGGVNYLLDTYPFLLKLSNNTHLFWSDEKTESFPGRCTKAADLINGRNRKQISGMQLNVVCRNHPLKPDQIKRKYKISDGSSRFLYCCSATSKEVPVIIMTE